MSRVQRTFHGSYEFGRYPLIHTRSQPDISIQGYTHEFLNAPLKNTSKTLIDYRTGRDFYFWSNYVDYLQNTMEPKSGYICLADEWETYRRDNYKLHSKVIRLERSLTNNSYRYLKVDPYSELAEITLMKSKWKRPLPKEKEVQHYKRYEWPLHPEDLVKPLSEERIEVEPKHIGWTHSEEVNSWFLESKTPSMYKKYEDFLKGLYNSSPHMSH
ncbi:unnamed protein product [Lepeophtheirus salmonis]|uniref:(salmon louse) hypothetical protein n=1 Tax=Lepeophtheirus salmonis TaxID=72036 RepID=A0A0K2UYD9_LEPSM|nr:unnamed protein product [Lepeophtheirus salmonis]CAF2767056.1 unnamed protein product [Lepeophtheirus salmonis]